MPSQSELIRRFESAPLPELLKVIHRPNPDEAAALKVWLGPDRYETLRAAALQPRSRNRGTEKRRNVVVLHGIMGSELSVRDGSDDDKIWANVWNLMRGRIKELRMGPDGQPEHPSFASDMMRKYYIGMLTGLARDHNVQPFWFDWRRDLKDSAAALDKAVQQWFGASSEVYFVAHSMGGLVVRTWIRDFRKRWDKGCRLVMLGTPNHGSFAIPQVITGAHKMVRMLSLIDLPTKLGSFAKTLNTFPGSVQMLPSAHVMETMEPLYRAATWPDRGVSQGILDRARRHHDSLTEIVDPERMLYIAGVGHHTPCDFRDWSAMDRVEGYVFTPEGDGTVPHKLGFLENSSGKVPVRFSRASHGDLPNDTKVIAAVGEYLTTGEVRALGDKMTTTRELTRGKAAALEVEAKWEAEIADFAARVQRNRSRSATDRSADELRMEEAMMDGFLGNGSADSTRGASKETPTDARKTSTPTKPPKTRTIEIAVRMEDIGTFGTKAIKGEPDVDFLTVGHYQGVEPQFAELALDIRLSRALGLIGKTEIPEGEAKDKLFITRSTRRGSITMRLGEPCILPIPGGGPALALAGLGLPGTFGRAELHVMVRELITTLAQLGCKHLGTVLIGAGAENLDIPTACRIWLKALDSIARSGVQTVTRITFVQKSAAQTLMMDHELAKLLGDGGEFEKSLKYLGTSPSITALFQQERKDAEAEIARRLDHRVERGAPRYEPSPTFINVSRVHGGYEFSAITNSASVPQRVIKVDPALIEEVAGRLAASGDPECQTEWGCVLEQLLIPRDLRDKLFSSAAPVVFTVDASAARIPFEMLGIPVNAAAGLQASTRFLGMEEGFGVTRQFRTPFAPAPEAPRGEMETLRILIVADPAEDAPLEGAQEEAFALTGIVGRMNERLRNNHKPELIVDSLIGPSEATRAGVLKQLMRVRYDAVHFAGHCFYDKDNPAESGWLFHDGRNERITAAELSRLDRVPPFVFSNACESGVTPDRFATDRLGLGPAFAEAFFQRGVRNFICTAWPVDDAAALLFATTFYEALLGLSDPSGKTSTIRDAMILARRAIGLGQSNGGTGTWGAYQHYGNPSFRFMKSSSV